MILVYSEPTFQVYFNTERLVYQVMVNSKLMSDTFKPSWIIK